MEDLNALAFDFLSKLPTSIRKEILLFVLTYSFDHSPSMERIGQPPVDLLSEIKESLCSETVSGGLRKFGALLKVIAAIDFVLRRSIRVNRMNERRLPEMKAIVTDAELSNVVDQMVASREFSLAHLEQAQRTWDAYRSNQLSPDNLIAYEDFCLRPTS